MGGGTTIYNPFPYTPTIEEVFERILICIQSYNWSGYIHYPTSNSSHFLVFTYWGIDTSMDLDISPAASIMGTNTGDKYYDTILNYNEIYNYYTTGDTQSLMVGNFDLPLAFTQRTFDNINLQLFEDSSFELIRWINLMGSVNPMNSSSIRQTSIISGDINNKIIINNNLIPQDNNTLSLGDSDYMFSYVHAMDFCERGVMLRDTYLKRESVMTYTDIDNIFVEDD